MMEWWNSLEQLNQWFYGVAVFFSVIFLWQFISSLIGLGGAEVDADIDADGLDLDDIEAHAIEEAGETITAFKILSLRAILAFCTMFSWAEALYLSLGKNVADATLYAVLWGLAGWVVVALLVNLMRKLAETGTPRLATCVGRRGMVYLDIPANGQGEVRVLVSGTISHVKARSSEGRAVSAGAPIRVLSVLDSSTVEVEPADKPSSNESKTQ